MALTFSIRKGYEILLEITACEEVISNDTLIPHLIKKCFERVFQIIGHENNEVITLGEESEEEEENSTE